MWEGGKVTFFPLVDVFMCYIMQNKVQQSVHVFRANPKRMMFCRIYLLQFSNYSKVNYSQD